MVHVLETGFSDLVRICILLIELSGIVVIVVSMIRGLIGFIKKDESTRIQLAQGIMLGLEFKIGSEVLRSVIVSGWNELGTLGAVILLRSLLTLLLHWEIGVEEKRQKEKEEAAAALRTVSPVQATQTEDSNS
ncbi:MAG: DUF1622 domain-containing protein [Eubacteriales bacterium]|nr:DUF1622 domain-containing protein [Eubacteriales bacterium]